MFLQAGGYSQSTDSHGPLVVSPHGSGISCPSDIRFSLLQPLEMLCLGQRWGSEPGTSPSYSPMAPTHTGWELQPPPWNMIATWIRGGQEACPCLVPTKRSEALPALGRTAASMPPPHNRWVPWSWTFFHISFPIK